MSVPDCEHVHREVHALRAEVAALRERLQNHDGCPSAEAHYRSLATARALLANCVERLTTYGYGETATVSTARRFLSPAQCELCELCGPGATCSGCPPKPKCTCDFSWKGARTVADANGGHFDGCPALDPRRDGGDQ